jgi:hypothetical protein
MNYFRALMYCMLLKSVLFQGDWVWLEPEAKGGFSVSVGAVVTHVDHARIVLVDDDRKVFFAQ